MEIARCRIGDIALVIEAVSVVKAEEDDVVADEKALLHFLSGGSNTFLVATLEGQVVGYAVAYRLNRIDAAGDMLCLYEIGVLRECRQRGIGSTLINELKKICRENGFSKMWVPTNKSNVAACGLYQKTGGVESAPSDEVSFTYKFS